MSARPDQDYGSNNVSAYSIKATIGALTSIGTVAAGTYPRSVVVAQPRSPRNLPFARRNESRRERAAANP
uniref:Uncharacterized protein n=1 Tax=mine drainage metagenome TaxID=410659 RepID=E6PMM8_9ZZZZ